MPASRRTDLIAINQRLPRALHKALKQQAKRNGVPLNTEIIERLQNSLGAEDDIRSDLKRLEQEIKATKEAVEKSFTPLSELGRGYLDAEADTSHEVPPAKFRE